MLNLRRVTKTGPIAAGDSVEVPAGVQILNKKTGKWRRRNRNTSVQPDAVDGEMIYWREGWNRYESQNVRFCAARLSEVRHAEVTFMDNDEESEFFKITMEGHGDLMYEPKPKPESWKQDTPQQQAATLIGCIEGWISNLKDGTSKPERVADAIMGRIEDLKILAQWLPDKW